jgi:hypothetical protein
MCSCIYLYFEIDVGAAVYPFQRKASETFWCNWFTQPHIYHGVSHQQDSYIINTSMNKRAEKRKTNPDYNLCGEFVFVFILFFKHPKEFSNSIECPFDFLYALKPKNPV